MRAVLIAVVFLATSWTSSAAGLPTPAEFAGFPIGSDGSLVKWDRIVEYFRLADESSDRILSQEIGKTTLGKPFLLVTVSSPSNLSRLGEIRAVQRRLAYPGELGEDEASRLAWSTPAVLLVTLNIHSTEIGSSQMALELIHRLATEESPWMRNMLDNVVFLLVPSMNPDGQVMVTEWYDKVKGTEHEGASMPWLYHHYAGHDNNRDAFMLTQKESRLLTKVLYQDWFPQVFLDEHQMGFSNARIFVPPWTNPINPNVDPLIWGENGLLGFSIFSALHEAGKEGVIYDTNYTSWWQGGFVMEAWWHNIVGLLTEVASVRIASPVEQEQAKLGVPPEGKEPSRREMQRMLAENPEAKIPAPRDVMPRNNYPRPWLGGRWTLRDIVDYELVATYALLEAVANNRVMLIENQVKMGRRAIEAGKNEKPYAFVFPPDPHDPAKLARMLELLHYAGVEVHRAEEGFEANGRRYPAGTHLVLMAQPFRAYAKDILEIQTHPDPSKYPAGTMREQPYDVTGWTLPLQMGVEAVRVEEPFDATVTQLDAVPMPRGEVRSAGASGEYGFLIRPEPNNTAVLTNRLLAEGARVSWLTAARDGSPPGSLHVENARYDRVTALAEELGLFGYELEAPLDSKTIPLAAPRVGLYQPWTASMDEGWTRFVLEEHEFSYETLHNAEIRAGNLRERLDVIIFPGDQDRERIVEGNDFKTTPPEYKGGIGEEGLGHLEEFVREGGTLVLMDSSTSLALESWPIPLRNVVKDLSGEEFSCPGSLLRIEVDPSHPIAFGMARNATAVFGDSAAFDLAPGFSYTDVTVIARYPNTNPLQSGWIRGEAHLANRIAAAEVGYERGRIVLIGFRPQFRAQPHNTFKLLFNAIHYAGADGASRPTSDSTMNP
ncbi:MAG TPA: M14 metallopeptidase family protein [Vicinamibacteria bacterium]|nr:M14 metallopeptidase family protein [Vicinamibacteria bacterium]